MYIGQLSSVAKNSQERHTWQTNCQCNKLLHRKTKPTCGCHTEPHGPEKQILHQVHHRLHHKIKSLHLGNKEILATMDVMALYTNIPSQLRLKFFGKILQKTNNLLQPANKNFKSHPAL